MTETARTTWIRTLLIALLGIVMLGLSPVMAVADDGSEALGFKTESYATGPYASFASYRAEDGAVGYCLDYGKAAPSSSGFTSYDQGWNWVEGVANVIAYNGYPNTTTIAGHELDRDQARCATQLALWMDSESVGPDGISASGTSFTGAEGRTEITEAARDLYNKAASGELTAPRYAKRYESSDQRQSMLWAPATFSLTIGKRDSATKGTAQPGASLEGAEYRLVSLTAPNFEKTGTTDSNGTLTFGNVPTGTIQVTETKAPVGYRLDPEPRTYTVSNEDAENGDHIELVPENDFLEHVIAFDVQISKFTDDDTNDGSGLETPAGGVAFDLISNSTGEAVGRITTDEQGYASTEGQWFGLGTRPDGVNGALPYDCKGYTVHEVEETVPEGFEALDDWTIGPDQMEDGAVLRYIADNHILSSKLQIAKVDAESNAIVPKAGFSFQILKENGSPVTQDDWR